MAKKTNGTKMRTSETLRHDKATLKNAPTAEYQRVLQKEAQVPVLESPPRRRVEVPSSPAC